MVKERKENNMAQYIDKSAVVAEIEKMRDKAYPQSDWNHGYTTSCDEVLSFLDTLEVQEDDLLTEKKTEKELAEIYINIFDKKFGDKLPKLKSKQLAEFKNFINTCEQIFHIKYFDYHATQGKLFEKLALLWAVWGKDHLTLEAKEVDLDESARNYLLHEHVSPLNEIFHQADLKAEMQYHKDIENAFKAGYELGMAERNKVHKEK